jgi:GntR family transcriptional regulator
VLLKLHRNTLIDNGGVHVLDRRSPVPLYRQIEELLRQWIEEGNYKPGDVLPSEPDLESQFEVSRITVRQAIAELVQEGLLERERGKGTFVREPKITQKLNQISSWAETIQAIGMTPRTVESRIEEVKPPAWVKRIISPSANGRVTRITRLRYANDEPMCIMTNYIRSDYVPRLEQEGLISESLYETLERRYKILLNHAEETVEATVADKMTAEKLKIYEGDPLLIVTRVTYNQLEEPIEVVTVKSRADRYQYSATLTGRPKSAIR